MTQFHKHANFKTLKYSSHHCETPKSTEIVKISIFSGFSDF